ncbi:MAG: hypothetical protein HY699_13355 [Deltaproteobacteria bacterium]|nr:hypothetical protein [Deltaproteobacteria bacterium]
MERAVNSYLYQLFALNLVLQMFDGMATYSGLALGCSEANPLLQHSFAVLGVGPTLLLVKAKACGLLLLLHRRAPQPLGKTVMHALAAIYCVLSLGPWLAKFLVLASYSL